jgi:hypothetical protein
MTELLWHYTKRSRLVSILRSGVILVSATGFEVSARPAVWFSRHPEWEATVGNHPRARIGVAPETAPYDWQAFQNLSGVGALTAEGLALAAEEMGGDPNHWFVSFEPVPRDKWLSVEVHHDGGKWHVLKRTLARISG